MTEPVDSSRTVLIDMAGVLADFDGAVLDRLPRNITRVAREHFYISDDYPEHMAHVRYITSHPEFFRSLPLVRGALQGWQRLMDLGYDPRICSAPLSRNKESVEGKLAWLEEHFVPFFGAEVVSRAIIDKDKYKYDGLVLIDDRPDVDTNNGQAPWRHVIFDQPCNQRSSALLRLHGWEDPNLGAVLEHAAQSNRG